MNAVMTPQILHYAHCTNALLHNFIHDVTLTLLLIIAQKF